MALYICGDSTAAFYAPERAPSMGWGQVLGEFLPGITVVNAAMGGRSTKSFLAEGRLQAIEKTLQAGDLLLIQFTHNDAADLVWRHTEPYTAFSNNLSIFVDTARLAGVKPVLMTPICRRRFAEGRFLPSHGAYPEAVRTLALQKNVPLIDLYRMSAALLERLGDEASKPLYMHVKPGIYADYPDGLKDDTHTQRAGAERFAHMAADALREMGLV